MPRRLHRFCLLLACWAACGAALAPASAFARSRIKDIVEFEGVRDNMLVGYGIVVGLNGTGDTLRNSPFTRQSLQAMLERLGVNVRDAGADLNTKNVAAVMVTARLPAFSASGSSIDASVSASGSSGSTVLKGVPTAGRIAGGAIVEREVGFQLAAMTQLRMTLRNPDFTTAQRISAVINANYPGSATAENPTIVTLRAPAGRNLVSFITEVEQMEVEPDAPAKVVIDEVSGVIVMGDDVRVSTVAIAQGNLTISVQETPTVSQPAPFSKGTTQVVNQSSVRVEEEKGKHLLVVKEGASLATLVAGLNALGVTPRDMISILQTIKAAGALQADIEVM
jgi:flagellar P-ring protein precursor FlgI